MIIYLEARLYLLRFRYIKPLIQLAALIAAFVTCLSRISDYHHRGSDVIGGAILGKYSPKLTDFLVLIKIVIRNM